MLQVSGLVAVPSEPDIQVTETDKYCYLNFNLVAPDPRNPTSEDKMHFYKANLSIKKEEKVSWLTKLMPGNIFLISGASNWSAQKPNNKDYPFNVLKLDKYNFKQLKKPYWISNKVEEVLKDG